MNTNKNNYKFVIRITLLVSVFVLIAVTPIKLLNHLMKEYNSTSVQPVDMFDKYENEQLLAYVEGNETEEIISKEVAIVEEEKIIEENIFIDPFQEFINSNGSLIDFYAGIFRVDSNVVKSSLQEKYEYDGTLLLGDNIDLEIISYMESLISSGTISADTSYVPYSGSSEYIESLIYYLSNVYGIDGNIAVSIGAAESGYYQVDYMLSRNNPFGLMGNGGLIRYNTMELSVLNYVKYLKYNYFDKGLNTVSSIGYVFCPTRNEAGVKIASPHWVNLVNNAIEKYSVNENVYTYEDVINKK